MGVMGRLLPCHITIGVGAAGGACSSGRAPSTEMVPDKASVTSTTSPTVACVIVRGRDIAEGQTTSIYVGDKTIPHARTR